MVNFVTYMTLKNADKLKERIREGLASQPEATRWKQWAKTKCVSSYPIIPEAGSVHQAGPAGKIPVRLAEILADRAGVVVMLSRSWFLLRLTNVLWSGQRGPAPPGVHFRSKPASGSLPNSPLIFIAPNKFWWVKNSFILEMASFCVVRTGHYNQKAFCPIISWISGIRTQWKVKAIYSLF